MNAFYAVTISALTIASWGFVDSNAPLPKIAAIQPLLYGKTIYPTAWYIATIVILFCWYAWVLHSVKKGMLSATIIWLLIFLTIVLLSFSYPAFSNDIFNYIATAKMTFFYRENPYIVMPIDIPNEPMLAFLHAANKVALYGPVWILLSAIPYVLGMGNLLATMWAFKLFVAGWYLFLCALIWIESGRKPWALAFFGLNPLVTISTLVDGHNDVVMMGFALLSLIAVKRRRVFVGTLLLLASIFIKGATVFLLPVLLAPKRTWYWASMAMYAMVLLSPIREEIYAWYFIWPLPFLALAEKQTLLHAASYGFSFGLMLRVAPFLYTRSWAGITPIIKKIVTFVPPLISALVVHAKTTRR